MGLTFLIGAFGMWALAMETLAIIITSVILAIVIGLPLGIVMAESDRAETALRPILDGMQTMPSFVYFVPAMMLFGLGKVPTVLATLIYSLPPVIRLTNLGIRQIPGGAGGGRRLRRQPVAAAAGSAPALRGAYDFDGHQPDNDGGLAMVVIASMIGARGLGQEVLLAINRIEVGRGFQAGMSVVASAIVIDRLTQLRPQVGSPQRIGPRLRRSSAGMLRARGPSRAPGLGALPGEPLVNGPRGHGRPGHDAVHFQKLFVAVDAASYRPHRVHDGNAFVRDEVAVGHPAGIRFLQLDAQSPRRLLHVLEQGITSGVRSRAAG